MIKSTIIFLLLLASLPSIKKGSYNENRAAEKLKEITFEDKKKIQALFQYLIWDSLFAYSLFGNKPVSTVGFYKPLLSQKLIFHSNFYSVLLTHWKLWEKHQHLFPSHKYTLIAKENEKWLEIILINRPACLKKIEENLALFQEKLSANLSAEEILKKMEYSKNRFEIGLNGSHSLNGILYGYGRENSLEFERQLKDPLLHAQSSLFHQENLVPFLQLKLPNFKVFFEDSETQQLRNDYEKQREEILKIYSKGDFLEITLQKLIEN